MGIFETAWRMPSACVVARRRHGLPQLDHRQRVVARPVVARHHVKVLGACHVDRRIAAVLQLDQRQLARVLRAERLTLWNLEDLGHASRAVQGAYMQFVQARACGEHTLPAHVRLIATTNRPSDKGAGVDTVLAPLQLSVSQLKAKERYAEDVF